MRNIIIGIILGACTATVSADSYTLDPRHTGVTFAYNHLGYTTQRGRFDETTGEVEFDPGRQRGAVHVRIKADSLSTPLRELEKILKGGDYFDVAHHPVITFDSDSLRFVDDKLVGVDGLLTIRGIQRPVHLDASSFVCKPNPMSKRAACGGDLQGSVKRSDFGMTGFVPIVSDEIRLSIPVFGYRDVPSETAK